MKKKATIAKLLVVCLIVGLMGASIAATPAAAPSITAWTGTNSNYTYAADADVTLGSDYRLTDGVYTIKLGNNKLLQGGKLDVRAGASVYVNGASAETRTDDGKNLFYAVGPATVTVNKNDVYYRDTSDYAINVSVTLSKGGTFAYAADLINDDDTPVKVSVKNGGTGVKADGYINYVFKSSSTGGGGGGAATTPTTPDNTPAKDTEVEVKPTTTTKEDGTVVSEATVDNKTAETMVSDAVANKSENVTVTVDAPDNATEVSATIPASAAKDLANKTDAALTVDTPVANVTLPNEALADLGSSSGTVTVTAAKTEDDTVQITVAKNGSDVGTVKGGIKVAVPVENATTGTVAVLVNADGTETVIKKSVAVDGDLLAALDGSATIKIVDNSKSFADASTHWGKSAVDFVTSRELFNGTGTNTFEPDTKMNRAMLVTVLHRLEDTPRGGTPAFGDVSSGAWYTEAVAWASANGIVNGYGEGVFAPAEEVTREQIATILYRYAVAMNIKTPESGSLNKFADGANTSDWAKDAMEWAVGAGLFQGSNGNINPKDAATRAEVATLLMRFVEYMA
ncbi:MAG: S-layer homology domain-containing protein [Ruminococcus flavefaciens]|nr:S-layer homology domain-containing protein [Ruminococcus flavefaciens]